MPIDLEKMTRTHYLYQIQPNNAYTIIKKIGNGDQNTKILLQDKLGDDNYSLYQHIFNYTSITSNNKFPLLSIENSDNVYALCIEFQNPTTIEKEIPYFKLKLMVNHIVQDISTSHFTNIESLFIDSLQKNNITL